ncbi:PREDICTED: MKL/myocardin-like protein 1 isoform X2 [Nicrophorus vespilloides]|nr:PREDICTED: MKL/myocardin-like protein 1 isoform X2 [Nicrophorus vespilloides]
MAEGGGSGGGCSSGGGGAAGGGGSTGMSTSNATPRESPPKAIVDTSPLLKSKEQNKESLKVKLMLRRPAEELRAQGIMPPLKTPAAFHGQRRQLERAKTGDLLKNKIQQRPSRYELESRHILEADPNVDPSLAEKQRMLKKARLADQLNDQLSHRPGPLELIQKNILHTEETIEHAVKSGHIPYRATCEGQLNRPQHPLSYINPEDDSQSSEDNNVSASPPASNSLDVLETAAKSAGIVVSLLPTTVTEGTATALVVTRTTPVVKDNSEIFADLCRSVAAPLLHSQQSSPASLVSSTSTLSPLSSIASPVPSIVSQPPTPAAPPLPLTPRPIQSPVRSDAPGKDKNRKKSKSKAIPKTRTIKFHEYKGPPSAQKNTPNNALPGESSYDLLLQQQTLLLQFQLQLQHKYPQIILPASQKSPNSESSCQPISNNNSNSSASPSPAPSMDSVTSVNPTRLVGRLEDMKVSDLKAELKRRNLPVSGSKPHLIERLKSNLNNNTNQDTSSMVPSSADESSQHTDICGGSPIKTETDIKSEPMEICNPLSPTIMHNDVKTQEEIVREQKRQIEELQRELTLSQLKLQAATMVEPKAQSFALKKHIQARMQQQPMVIQMQHFQALHNEEQQKLQQQQHVAFQNQKNNQLLLNHNTAALVLNHLNRVKGNRNYFIANEVQEEKPPPIYEEAIKKEVKSNIKSQSVDDVLEILIKNGELPASAAQEPITPNSGKPNEPAYPINSPESGLELDTSDLLETLDSLENMDFSQLIEMSGHQQQQQQQQNQVQQQQQHIMNNHDVLTSSNTVVPMDTDDWLESLLPSDIQCNNNNNNNNNNNSVNSMQQDLIYDPLMGIAQEPFDPFCLEEFRPQPASEMALSWGDKVDFAA